MKTTHTFDLETMRQRFHELTAQKARVLENDVDPLRKQMDEIIIKIQQLEASLKPIDKTYREKRELLVPIDREMAIIARALGGKLQ